MDATLPDPSMLARQDRAISAIVRREAGRLRKFIRTQVRNAADAEDILQDALYELVAAQRLLQPIEKAGAWLLRVTRNRIIDRFRRGRVESAIDRFTPDPIAGDEGTLEELLPDLSSLPESAAMQEALLERIEQALDELPREQREVFIAHELEGASYKELAERWGTNINTLLARKRYAIAALRERLQSAYDDWLEE